MTPEPHWNENAERGLLSSLIRDPQRTASMMAERKVTADAFHGPYNNLIATILLDAWAEGTRMDTSLLVATLTHRGELEKIGGFMGVIDRVDYVPTAANAEQYLDLVQETDKLRRIVLLCDEKREEAYSSGAEADVLLSGISEAVTSMSGAGKTNRWKSMMDLTKEKLSRIEGNEDDKDIIKTGIEKLDKFSPLKEGDMPLISGERKAGKSILSINIALHVALSGSGVLYFSLEDSASKVYDRMFANNSRVPMGHHRAADMSEMDLSRVQAAAMRLSAMPMQLRDDVHDLTGIVAVIRQSKQKDPKLKLVVVDYAQLVVSTVRKGGNREEEVALVSRTLRLLAMDLKVAIILLCQLNKDGNARWSMGLEHDCTAMWKVLQTEDKDNGKRIIEIPFQRNGDSGIGFPVAFLGSSARIETLYEDPQ